MEDSDVSMSSLGAATRSEHRGLDNQAEIEDDEDVDDICDFLLLNTIMFL